MIVCFTGHRPQKLGGYETAGNAKYEACYSAVTDVLHEISPSKAITGMALGFDQWAGWACFELNIPFIAAVPFFGQESVWPDKSKRLYSSLLRNAEKVHIVCDGGYQPYKMQLRNEWMVDNSDIVIACWSGEPSGTANAIKYAFKKHKKVYCAAVTDKTVGRFYAYSDMLECQEKILEIKNLEN